MIPSTALPQILVDEEERKWSEFRRATDNAGIDIPDNSSFIHAAKRAFLFSNFIFKNCIRHPDLLTDLVQSGDPRHPYPADDLAKRLITTLDGVNNETDLMVRLRRFRCREMVRIAWRDLCGQATVPEVMADLSSLADAVLDTTLGILADWYVARLGHPSDIASRRHLAVIGMGKLGAQELNFSSDVDLVFAYPSTGAVSPEISNDEFFTRLGRQLIRVLHTPTTDGFVFRVDMDLRPFGNSGPLVMNFDAMEDYFVSQGREWERYAWIKARATAGDKAAGHDLLKRLKPFVFRRYLDYGVYESLREMKVGISAEIKRKGVRDDIKLGPGGIREIEFFGQVFQLLRGGVIPTLQQRPILTVLTGLAEEKIISASVAKALSEAYLFLRGVEHRLQMYNDQQTHRLPSDDIGWWRLGLSMGFDDISDFRQTLDQHIQTVQSHFEALLEPERNGSAAAIDPEDIKSLQHLWNRIHGDPDDETGIVLSTAGFHDSQCVIRLLKHLDTLPATHALSLEGRGRLDRLVPLVLKAAGAAEQPEQTLSRILDLIGSIETRSVYLAMLLENPGGINLLVRLAVASPMIVSLLAKHPVLLDELLDPRLLYAPPCRVEMEKDIAHRLTAVPADDLEFQIETLCVFKQVNILRIAAADVTGKLPLMNVSDRLTDIAEIVLTTVANLAWEHLVARHGRPVCDLEESPHERGFAVIAYGKLGGLELSYSSDLDLVFLHAGCSGQATDGRRPIDSAQFFARLGQRVIHLLSTRTRAGVLYDIDMRLRPDGSGGMLVTHIDQFNTYQRDTARTWEHQALIKARPVIGDPLLMKYFKRIRQTALHRRRDPVQLRNEVKEMREQLYAEHGSQNVETFDLKHDSGGIIDIEFLVQYLVLRLSPDYSELSEWTDNVRLIQTLIETGIIHDRQAYLLKQAYLSYRMVAHRLALQEKPAEIDAGRFQNRRQAVIQIWRRFFVSPEHTS
ncbi:MAG: bifunctional [glutamate--ammonia ligase]-adenylyl-L-tyrosine phosphorylase/[glutamate--ammonia-ligase] adenylyltransferase [Thermodesulfobacteriota bacterium]|nr:bifunctional [glutamate--ammonia ligase]-adenylyl-L-tyrosine phosphorylase/[glutamate--ammonia-ligase] adenylyltransferase [Thermodesulfobacteriota bacterium]